VEREDVDDLLNTPAPEDEEGIRAMIEEARREASASRSVPLNVPEKIPGYEFIR
jgi:hypothetical protein